MKKIQRLTVAELKQLVKKPETVEVIEDLQNCHKKIFSNHLFFSGGMLQPVILNC